MAWRITDYVEHGEIDNREKGRVTGRLWLHGIEEPIVLELTGNPYRDLAGQRLRFMNPAPKAIPEQLRDFAREQTGVVGDITAARKVKVLDIPDGELKHYYTNKIPMPYHWGNCLYLEWHSVRNGRVVIEATEYVLEIEPEAAWQMSETEEATQLEANGRAIVNFMEQLIEATESAVPEDPEEDDAPQSEAEAAADAEAARMDLLNDRVMTRLMKNKEANAEDYARILDEERERLRREFGDLDTVPFPEVDENEEAKQIEIHNSDFAEAMAREGEECEIEADPLVEHCQELGDRVREDIEQSDWLPAGAQEEHPLRVLQNSIWSAAAKLAGALNGRAGEWPPEPLFAGDCLVRLKKARSYLRDSLAGLHDAEADKLAEPSWLSPIRQELHAILESVQSLIAEVRSVLRRSDGQ